MWVRFERVVRGDWGLSMHVVDLGGGDLLVYSPTWLGDDTFARVEALGRPRMLVAPNHYHHLSLGKFRERYPDALAVAHGDAIPRLTGKGHEGLVEPEAFDLPPSVTLVPCEGTKNGELWVEVDAPGERGWLVGDAFFHMQRRLRGATGLFLRLTQAAPGLCIGDTFRWVGIRDARYREWLLRRLDERPPTRVGFCHGEPLEGTSTTAALSALARERLG